jgi:circadian clock protein KaiC
VPGLHTFRITGSGLQAFPRTLGLTDRTVRGAVTKRLSFGISELDKMTGGGIPEGDSLLVGGPSGAGKSILAAHFIAEGIRQGEPGIIAVFEERPMEYAARANKFGIDFEAARQDGMLEVIYFRPLDLSVDETTYEFMEAVRKIKAKRLVIDSLSGFERALASDFRADFGESLYRLIGALTGTGVTVLSTIQVEESFGATPFSGYKISFLTDDIIKLRYAEIEGRLHTFLNVVKIRGSNHSKDIREYEITLDGLRIGNCLLYRSDTTGTSRRCEKA